MKKILLIFLLIVFYAGYLIFTKLLFGDNNLISIKGKMPKYFRWVKTGILKEQNIEVAYLTFRLDKDERTYTLKTVITDIKNGAHVFDGVAFSLGEATEVEVDIRKMEIAATAAKVYRIMADGKEIFHIIKKPGNNSRLYLFLLLCMLLFCSAYYWLQCLSIPLKKAGRSYKWSF